MEIVNLSQNQPNQELSTKKPNNISLFIIIIIGITAGFWLSRYFPSQKSGSIISLKESSISQESIKDEGDLKVGELYGNTANVFKDEALGVIEKGDLNGEGTHTLIREGGKDQRAALTSSVLDLDLFVGRKVEINGETHTSTRVGWFLDVGTVKILE